MVSSESYSIRIVEEIAFNKYCSKLKDWITFISYDFSLELL